jgi:hypothetical protein
MNKDGRTPLLLAASLGSKGALNRRCRKFARISQRAPTARPVRVTPRLHAASPCDRGCPGAREALRTTEPLGRPNARGELFDGRLFDAALQQVVAQCAIGSLSAPAFLASAVATNSFLRLQRAEVRAAEPAPAPQHAASAAQPSATQTPSPPSQCEDFNSELQ